MIYLFSDERNELIYAADMLLYLIVYEEQIVEDQKCFYAGHEAFCDSCSGSRCWFEITLLEGVLNLNVLERINVTWLIWGLVYFSFP